MYDHRKIGRELGLFDSDPLIGAGLPYWLPAGAGGNAIPSRSNSSLRRSFMPTSSRTNVSRS